MQTIGYNSTRTVETLPVLEDGPINYTPKDPSRVVIKEANHYLEEEKFFIRRIQLEDRNRTITNCYLFGNYLVKRENNFTVYTGSPTYTTNGSGTTNNNTGSNLNNPAKINVPTSTGGSVFTYYYNDFFSNSKMAHVNVMFVGGFEELKNFLKQCSAVPHENLGYINHWYEEQDTLEDRYNNYRKSERLSIDAGEINIKDIPDGTLREAIFDYLDSKVDIKAKPTEDIEVNKIISNLLIKPTATKTKEVLKTMFHTEGLANKEIVTSVIKIGSMKIVTYKVYDDTGSISHYFIDAALETKNKFGFLRSDSKSMVIGKIEYDFLKNLKKVLAYSQIV